VDSLVALRLPRAMIEALDERAMGDEVNPSKSRRFASVSCYNSAGLGSVLGIDSPSRDW